MSALAREQFSRRVLKTLIKTPPDPHPLTLFVGGQPGAGKSMACNLVTEMHHNHHIVPIIGDDFRQLHPDYDRAVEEEPLCMPDITAALAGELVGISVAWANERSVSCLIEGTWRNAGTMLGSAREARAHGRTTHAVLVCVSPRVSRISALVRFFGEVDPSMARWTPPARRAQMSVAAAARRLQMRGVAARTFPSARASQGGLSPMARRSRASWGLSPLAGC